MADIAKKTSKVYSEITKCHFPSRNLYMLTLQQKPLSDQPIKRQPVAISTNTNPKAHLDVAAKQYADSGYNHIELQVEHGAMNDIKNPRVICGLTHLRQLYPKLKFSGHASYKKTDLAASDEIVRQKSVARVKKEIDFFKEFDVKLLTVHTGRGLVVQKTPEMVAVPKIEGMEKRKGRPL